MALRINVVALMIVLLFAVLAEAGTATIGWNASAGEKDGYRLYWGTSPGDHTNVIDAGNVLQYGPIAFPDNTVVYLSATSYQGTEESSFAPGIVFRSGVGNEVKTLLELQNFGEGSIPVSNFGSGSVPITLY